MSELKKVSKAEFESFLAAYPRALEKHVSQICDPAMISYNDFDKAAAFPDSIVAQTWDGLDEFYISQT